MKRRVLVIDDDEMMRAAIGATLQASGYEFVQSGDGEDGLRQARSIMPDLIVCDINMPRLNGFELIQQLRKSSETSNIPFVFLSGQAERADMRKGMMLGADDYLTKPFSAEELIRVIEIRLKKREAFEQQMQTKLEELRKSISLSLPHEFRTPLTGILGFAEILQASEGMDQEEVVYIGQHIHTSAKRLHHLLENMLMVTELDLLAADSGRRKKFEDSVSSIGMVVTQAAESLAKESGRLDDIQIEVQDANVGILESHLAKIVGELLSNALKFSITGTKVNVSTSVNGNEAILLIEDKGAGMTKDQIQSIGAFVQFDRSRQEQQGSGLGLILVKKIAQLYNGSLSIESTPSIGTRVSVRMPLGR